MAKPTVLHQEYHEVRRPVIEKTPRWRVMAANLIDARPQEEVEDLVKPYGKVLRRDDAALESLALFALREVKAQMERQRQPVTARSTNGGVQVARKRDALVKRSMKLVVRELMGVKINGKSPLQNTGIELAREAVRQHQQGGALQVLCRLAGGPESKATPSEKGVTQALWLKALGG